MNRTCAGHPIKSVVGQVSLDELEVVGEHRHVEVARPELGLDEVVDRLDVVALLRVPATGVEVGMQEVAATNVEGDVRGAPQKVGRPGHVRVEPARLQVVVAEHPPDGDGTLRHDRDPVLGGVEADRARRLPDEFAELLLFGVDPHGELRADLHQPTGVEVVPGDHRGLPEAEVVPDA